MNAQSAHELGHAIGARRHDGATVSLVFPDCHCSDAVPYWSLLCGAPCAVGWRWGVTNPVDTRSPWLVARGLMPDAIASFLGDGRSDLLQFKTAGGSLDADARDVVMGAIVDGILLARSGAMLVFPNVDELTGYRLASAALDDVVTGTKHSGFPLATVDDIVRVMNAR